MVCLHACSDPERERLRETTRPTYDRTTGKLAELTYDADRNGRIDTWTEMDGARPLRARIDRDEDGTIDRWEYYDDGGALVKVGFSRAGEGRPDAWAYAGPDGRLQRIELSSAADERRIDRWEHYDGTTAVGEDGTAALAAAEEDTNADGRVDKWETFAEGALRTVAFDENGDGHPDRRLTYGGAALVLIERQPDGAGGFRERVEVK